MRVDLINERMVQRAEEYYIDRINRPGREGQATVGHAFLSRAALTKTNPQYITVYTYDEEGSLTQITYALYGFSSYGDSDTYA